MNDLEPKWDEKRGKWDPHALLMDALEAMDKDYKEISKPNWFKKLFNKIFDIPERLL